ncbi:MAG: sulfite exporter TauE/SafE family protein, partial [Phycisphaerae bacterium]
MNAWPLLGAVWLGVQISISPCTLAGNIAAISVLSRQAGRPLRVLGNGLLYCLGRSIAYVSLAMIILMGVRNVQV